jgi:hypothetical protein
MTTTLLIIIIFIFAPYYRTGIRTLDTKKYLEVFEAIAYSILMLAEPRQPFSSRVFKV